MMLRYSYYFQENSDEELPDPGFDVTDSSAVCIRAVGGDVAALIKSRL